MPNIIQLAADAEAANRKSKAVGNFIDRMSNSFVQGIRGAAISKDQQSIQDAETDVLQNTINPDREHNEAAYSAVIFQNQLHKESKDRLNRLSDPSSAEVAMSPEDYTAQLQKDARDAYGVISKNPHSEVMAKVFNKFAMENQKFLIGKHASQHRMFQTNKTAVALKDGFDGLAGLDPDQDHGAAVEELLTNGWNKGLLKRDEVADIMMGVAMENSQNGDRRLLDFAVNKWGLDSSAKHQARVKASEREYENFKWEEGEADANKRYRQYTILSERGLFTDAMFDKLIEDQDSINRKGWGKAKIVQWWKQSRKAQIASEDSRLNVIAFDKGLPLSLMNNAKYQTLVDNWINTKMSEPDANITQVSRNFADRLGKQGRTSKTMQREFNSYFGNFALDESTVDSPGFTRAMTIATAFENVMPKDIFIDQMGEDGHRNWRLMHHYAQNNGGDFKQAFNQVASIQKSRKERGLEMRMTKDEIKSRDTHLEDMISGDHDFSDPKMRKFFGLLRSGSAPVFSNGLKSRLHEAYEANVLTGMSPALAMDTASEQVAAKFKTFGNELQFTGGSSVKAFVGLPPNVDDVIVDGAFGHLADTLGYDRDDVHVTLSNGNAQIMLMDGNRVVGRESMRSTDIGEAYMLHLEQVEDKRKHDSQVSRDASEARRNRRFVSFHLNRMEDGMETTNNPVVVPQFEGKPEIKMDDLLIMSKEELTAARKHAINYRSRNLRKSVEHMSSISKSFIKGILSPLLKGDSE